MSSKKFYKASSTIADNSSLTENEIVELLNSLVKEAESDKNINKSLYIFSIISYFAPTDIYVNIFSMTNEELNDAINKLQGHSVITVHGKVINISKYVQNVVKSVLKDHNLEEETLKMAISLLSNQENFNHLDHSLSVWSYAIGYSNLLENLVGLPNNIIEELRIQIKYEESNIIGWEPSSDHEKRFYYTPFIIQFNIGRFISFHDTHEKATNILLQFLENDGKLAPEEVKIPQVLVLLQWGKLNKYKDMLLLYNSRYESMNGPTIQNEENIAFLEEYAYVLSLLDEGQMAINIIQQIIGIRRKVYGSNDDYISELERVIIYIFTRQCKFCAALNLLNKIFDKRKIVLGENHINTFRIKIDIAMVLMYEGKYDEALKILTEMGRKFYGALSTDGKKHPDLTVSTRNFFTIYKFKHAMHFSDIYVYHRRPTNKFSPSLTEVNKIFSNRALNLIEKENFYADITLNEIYLDCKESNLNNSFISINNVLAFFIRLNHKTIFSAANVGNLNRMILLIKNGVDIDNKNDYERTPIHYAAQLSHNLGVKLLLECDALSNSENPENLSPGMDELEIIKSLFNSLEKIFHHAEERGKGCVQDNEENITANEKGDKNPSNWSICSNCDGTVNISIYLRTYDIRVTNRDYPSIHISLDNDRIVNDLIQFIEPKNIENHINSKRVGGNTLLHIASKYGHFDLVKSLLKHGANYSAENNDGKSPVDLTNDENIFNFLNKIQESFADAKCGKLDLYNNQSMLGKYERECALGAKNAEGKTLKQVALDNKYIFITLE